MGASVRPRRRRGRRPSPRRRGRLRRGRRCRHVLRFLGGVPDRRAPGHGRLCGRRALAGVPRTAATAPGRRDDVGYWTARGGRRRGSAEPAVGPPRRAGAGDRTGLLGTGHRLATGLREAARFRTRSPDADRGAARRAGRAGHGRRCGVLRPAHRSRVRRLRLRPARRRTLHATGGSDGVRHRAGRLGSGRRPARSAPSAWC
jgi:hypothetical protein